MAWIDLNLFLDFNEINVEIILEKTGSNRKRICDVESLSVLSFQDFQS